MKITLPTAAPLVRLLVLLLVAAPLARAHGQQRTGWLKTPVVALQPGVVVSNLLDAPESADSRAELLLRVVTGIPTAIPRTTLVAAVQWAPLADEDGAGVARNEPAFHYGPVVRLLQTEQVAVDLDLLGEYSPSATAEDADERAYSHKLRVGADVYYALGRALLGAETPGALSRWQRTALYGTLANRVTGVDPDVEGRWTVQLGVSIPLAP